VVQSENADAKDAGGDAPEADDKPEDPDPSRARPLKRRRKSASQKVDAEKIVDHKALPDGPLQDVPMQLKNQVGLRLKVFMGNKMFVVNTSDKTVSILAGAFLCGYGKGKFDRNLHGSFNPDCHHMFHIKTCDDLVYTSKMLPVKDVVAEQKAKTLMRRLATTPCLRSQAKARQPLVPNRNTRSSSSLLTPAATKRERANQSRKVLWLGCSRPMSSRARTARCRRGGSSGLPLA